MTHTEAEELCLDVMTEFLPKSVSKVLKKETIREILREFVEQGALDLEDEPETEADGSYEDDEEDLTKLFP